MSVGAAVRHILYRLDIPVPTTLKPIADQLHRVGEEADKAKSKGKGMADVLDLSARKLGGSFGDLGDVVFEFGGTLQDVTGGIGGTTGAVAGLASGIAVAAAGTVVITKATKEWLDASVEANKRLQEAGLATEGQTAAIDDYAAASKRLDLTLDQVHVSAASLVAGPFADMLDTLGGLLGILPSVTSAFEKLRASWPGQMAGMGLRGMLGAATLGASEALRFGVNLGSSFWGSVGGTNSGPMVGPELSPDFLRGGTKPGVVHVAGPDMSGILGGNSPMLQSPRPTGPARPNYANATPLSMLPGGPAPGPAFLTAEQYAALTPPPAAVSVQSLTTYDDMAAHGPTPYGEPTSDKRPVFGPMSAADRINAVSGVVSSGGSFASLGGLTGNPVLGAVGGLLDNRDQIAGVIKGMDDAIVDLVRDLPQIILVDLPRALVTDFLPGLIKGLGEAIADGFKAALSKDGKGPPGILGLGKAFRQAVEEKDTSGLKSVLLGSFKSYTEENRGSASRTSSSRTSGGAGMRDLVIHVHSTGRPDEVAREVAREVRRQQGNFGTGLTLDPVR